MVYSNDDSDKSIRQRNFYLTVYLIPLALMAAICGLIYWASSYNYLGKTDTNLGYFLSLTPAFILYGFYKRNWLKMPDGTYHFIKGIAPTAKLNIFEPAEYEAEFFYSKREKVTLIVIGLASVGFGLWFIFKDSRTILVPAITVIGGLFFTCSGLKGLIDNTAKLKIAKNGLWTNKLGFVNWDDINFAEVVEDKRGETPQLYLEIRLKGTKFEAANQPDERLLLSHFKNKDSIEMVIVNSINNFNNQRI